MSMKLKKPSKNSIEEKNASQFINEAEALPEEKKYPWEGLSDTETRVFNLRMSKAMYEKVRFVAKNLKRKSMNDVCLDALDTHIEYFLNELIDD